MKNLFTTLFLAVTMLLVNSIAYSQGISINNDGTDADASAMLDVQSSSAGFLTPRMTEVQRDAISSPATGLVIYQTDGSAGFYYYDSEWKNLSNNETIYTTIAQAEAASGTDNDLCFIVETETYYRYEADGSNFMDDNKYVLSTADVGNTRWVGISGHYNLNSFGLSKIVHLDATAGTASITEINKIYYITAASSNTTITIPDADTYNYGFCLRIYKEAGNGSITVQTTSGQNIDGSASVVIYNIGEGLFIKSDNASEWLKIQDSRADIPKYIATSADYDGDSQDFMFNFMTANTSSNDITITMPATISLAPEGNNRMFFNTGSGRLFINTNGNTIDGLADTRIIAPGGFLELQKINGEIRVIREKYVSVEKNIDDIANLECWLDASQLSGSDGSLVSTWADLNNSNDFTASGLGQPTLQTGEQNGKNVVRFDGADDVMSAGDIELHDNSRGFTMIAVVKPSSTNRMAILSKYQTTGDNRQFAFGNKDNFLFEDLTWGSRTYANANLVNNDYQIVEVVWTPGYCFEYYVNGVLHSTGDYPVTDLSDGTANLKLGGGDYSYVGFWNGDFAEIAIYSDAVSDEDRKALRGNLAVKWDIDEIIIANGGGKYWQRDGNTSTISPDIADDNLDLGNGNLSGATLNASELLNAPALSTVPASPQAGSIYFNTNDNKLKVYTGSVWVNLN